MAETMGREVSTPWWVVVYRTFPDTESRRVKEASVLASETVVTRRRFGLRYLYITERSPRIRPIEATGSWNGLTVNSAIRSPAFGANSQADVATPSSA